MMYKILKALDSNAVSTAELKSPKIMKLLMSESSIEADILPMHSININKTILLNRRTNRYTE